MGDGIKDLLHYFFDVSCVSICLSNTTINVGITQGEKRISALRTYSTHTFSYFWDPFSITLGSMRILTLAFPIRCRNLVNHFEIRSVILQSRQKWFPSSYCLLRKSTSLRILHLYKFVNRSIRCIIVQYCYHCLCVVWLCPTPARPGASSLSSTLRRTLFL